jgi:hypothetical protein
MVPNQLFSPSKSSMGRGLGGGDTQHIHEPSSTAASYHLLGAPATPWPPPSPSLTPMWSPEGLRRRRESPSSHAIVLRSFRIPVQSRLLPHLGWKRSSGSHRGHRTCASTRRCRSCDTGIVAPRSSTTLRSATSSSSLTLVRERNPHVSVYEGTCLKLLPL